MEGQIFYTQFWFWFGIVLSINLILLVRAYFRQRHEKQALEIELSLLRSAKLLDEKKIEVLEGKIKCLEDNISLLEIELSKMNKPSK